MQRRLAPFRGVPEEGQEAEEKKKALQVSLGSCMAMPWDADRRHCTCPHNLLLDPLNMLHTGAAESACRDSLAEHLRRHG